MIFRNLDSNSDFTFGKGKNNYLRDDDAVKLNIRTRLLSWVNDCFFDIDAGIDWYNRLGSKNQRLLLEQDLKKVILSSEGVGDILSIFSSLTGRDFMIEYNIRTIFSQSFRDEVRQVV